MLPQGDGRRKHHSWAARANAQIFGELVNARGGNPVSVRRVGNHAAKSRALKHRGRSDVFTRARSRALP